MGKKVLMAALAAMMMSTVASAATVTLTAAQKAALLFMYQEEKVARDVYITLGKKYPTVKTFSNIASSEQTHTDSVEKLCIKYGVNISGVNESSVGNFVLPELQALYNTMVIQGSVNKTEGLKVGVAIEEKDIADIMKYATGMPSDVVNTFQNLLNGSYNHLAAFNSALK